MRPNGINHATQSLTSTDLERAKKRQSSNTEPDAACSSEFDAAGSIPKRPRRQALDKSKCIFCEQSTGKLHQFCTLEASKNVWCIATDLQNSSLLARIEGSDLIAIEAKYHLTELLGSSSKST